MSLWSNDGQVEEAAMVGIRVTLRKVGRNGGPKKPIDPAPLEAALRAFVGESAEVECWVSDDEVYWHAELRWEGGIAWDPVGSLSADVLARDIAAFSKWAEGVGAWLSAKPVANLPPTTVLIRAEYGKSWAVPLPTRSTKLPSRRTAK
jgi:hypothetical protein